MLELISYFNFVLALTISAAYFYQLVYLMYGLVSLRKPWIFVAQKQHRYAVMISARNEEEVIGELIGSLTSQNYPRELLDIYVVADNCTDDTAGAARRQGRPLRSPWLPSPSAQRQRYRCCRRWRSPGLFPSSARK